MQRTLQNAQVINSSSQRWHSNSTTGKSRKKPEKISALLTALLCSLAFFSMISSNLHAAVAPTFLDEVYGPNTAIDPNPDSGNNNLFDVYVPDGEGPYPFLIYAHGGGFGSGNKDKAIGNMPELTNEGIVFISLNYTFGGVEIAIADVILAINYILDNHEKYKIDVNNMFLSGSSAGGITMNRIMLDDKRFNDRLRGSWQFSYHNSQSPAPYFSIENLSDVGIPIVTEIGKKYPENDGHSALHSQQFAENNYNAGNSGMFVGDGQIWYDGRWILYPEQGIDTGESYPTQAEWVHAVVAAATPPVLTDDFEGSNTQYTWNTAGNWFSSSGVYNQVEVDNLYRAVIGDASWADYTFSFDMLTTYSLDNTKKHMVARGDFRVTDNQNLYFVRLRTDGVLQLQSLKDGAKTIIASVNTALSALDNHNYLVEASGSSIKVSVDGELLIDTIDTDHANGMIGLATNKAAATFDNVIVDLEVATPPPADGAYVGGYIYDSNEITAHNGLVYATKTGQHGTPEDIKMNVYVSPNSDITSAPLIILVHGGGFKSGDENKGNFPIWATNYARMGFVGASITYRKANPVQGDTSFKASWDVEDAVRYLKVNAATYGIDTNKIIIIGSSAGGFAVHALNVGMDSEVVLGNGEELGVDTERAFPNTSSKVTAAITTGAAMVGNSAYDALWMYDSEDSPMLLLHNGVQDTETGVTWAGVLDLIDTLTSYGITASAVPTTDPHTSSVGPTTRYFDDHIHPFILEHLDL